MGNKLIKKNDPDELDLMKDAIVVIWQQKWVIALVMFLSVLIGVIYISTTKPLYEAKSHLLPPTLEDMANFNDPGSLQEKLNYTYQIFVGTLISQATREDFFNRVFLPFLESVAGFYDPGSLQKKLNYTYHIFVETLTSQATREDFFNKVFLPSLPAEYRKITSRALLYKQFNSMVSFKEDSAYAPSRYTVIFKSHNPKQAADWSARYVFLAKENAVRRIVQDISNEAKDHERNLTLEISRLREDAKQQRLDKLVQLTEALNIAKEIGLENPKFFNIDFSDKPDVTYQSNERNMMYQLGSKALVAEIKTLNMRESDDPFFPKIRHLQREQDRSQFVLKNIAAISDQLRVFRFDGSADVIQVSPRKKLVLMLYLVLGMLVGIGAAFSRALLLAKGSRKGVA